MMRDLNPRPLEYESPTITTRPGLPPYLWQREEDAEHDEHRDGVHPVQTEHKVVRDDVISAEDLGPD